MPSIEDSDIKNIQSTQKGTGFEGIQDPITRHAAIAIADSLDEKARKEIVFAYTNKEYQKMVREQAAGDFSRKGSWMKHSLEVPVAVYDFLNSFFGSKEWVHNKKLWKHELVKPWVI